AGPMVITFKIKPTFPIVVIKTRVISKTVNGLECSKLPHPNIVNILEVFEEGEMVYLIYECLSVSLANI
ncbi:hypothetical protein V2W45_1247570, partial [Cenococcum geophilum]